MLFLLFHNQNDQIHRVAFYLVLNVVEVLFCPQLYIISSHFELINNQFIQKEPLSS